MAKTGVGRLEGKTQSGEFCSKTDITIGLMPIQMHCWQSRWVLVGQGSAETSRTEQYVP